MFRSKQFIIGIVISLVFLGWALYNERLDQVWAYLVKAQYWALLPALALYFAGVWVRAIRWRTLLKPIVPNIGLNETFKVVVIGYMANDVLPARIGELVRAYVLSRRTGVRKTSTLATIFVERVFDGLTMLGFAAGVLLFALIWEPGAFMTGADHRLGSIFTDLGVPIAIGGGIFLGLLVAFVVIASSRSRAERAIGLALRLLPGKLRDRGKRLAASFVDGLGSLRSRSSMAIVLVLSVVAWLFETSMYYALGTWGFDLRGGNGQPLPFYAYMLATAFANLSTLVPQAPGFIGVFDWIAKAVFVGAFGVVSDLALPYVLVLHATLLVPVTLLGFVYLWRESLSWKDLTGLEKTRAAASQEARELEGPFTDIELVQDGKLTQGDAETQLEQAGEEEPPSDGKGTDTDEPPPSTQPGKSWT